MNLSSLPRLRRSALALAAALAVLPAAAPANDAPAIEAMVSAALPAEAGDRAAVARLLSPPATQRPFSQSLSLARLESAVADQFARTPRCGSRALPPEHANAQAHAHSRAGERHAARHCFHEGRGSYLRFEPSAGAVKLSYANPARSYDPRNPVVDNPLGNADGQRIVMELAGALGLPAAEVQFGRIHTIEQMVASGVDGAPARTVRRLELTTRIPRQVGGVPVHGSRFSASVDARGQIASLRATWPDFRLDPRARTAPVVSREALARSIARDFAEMHGDGRTLARVVATVAYIDVTRLRNSGERAAEADDGSGVEQPPSGEARYVPGLVVRAIPVETGGTRIVEVEDRPSTGGGGAGDDGDGPVSLPVLEIVEPLVDLAATTVR